MQGDELAERMKRAIDGWNETHFKFTPPPPFTQGFQMGEKDERIHILERREKSQKGRRTYMV